MIRKLASNPYRLHARKPDPRTAAGGDLGTFLRAGKPSGTSVPPGYDPMTPYDPMTLHAMRSPPPPSFSGLSE